MTKWIGLLQDNDFIRVKQYLKDGADVNDHNENEESVLLLALKYKCDTDLIDLLIDSGADLDDFDDEGVSVFDYAVTYDAIDLVKKMVDMGTDVNHTQRRSGFTPLMCAVCYGRKDIVLLLLEKGADKDIIDTKGFSAVDFARKMRKKQMMEILNESPSG